MNIREFKDFSKIYWSGIELHELNEIWMSELKWKSSRPRWKEEWNSLRGGVTAHVKHVLKRNGIWSWDISHTRNVIITIWLSLEDDNYPVHKGKPFDVQVWGDRPCIREVTHGLYTLHYRRNIDTLSCDSHASCV